MKLIKVIILFLLFVFSFAFASAKPLPPGTGNAVPANILFLVDKSQSMHDHASGNNKTKNMRPPTDVAGRGDGNYFVSGVDESGYYYWDADGNSIVKTNSVFGGITHRAHASMKRNLGSPVQIEYHEGTKRIYALADSRDKGFGNNCKKGGFVLYTLDTTKGAKGKDKGPAGSHVFFGKAAHGNTLPMLGAFDCSKGPGDSLNKEGRVFLGKTAITMHGDKLWIVTSEIEGLIYSDMRVVDIAASSSNYGWGTGQDCADNLDAYQYFNESIDVVEESGVLYMYSKDNTSRAGQILKQKLDAQGCMDTSSGTQYTNWNNSTNQDKCGSSNKGGASIVVKDQKIYTTGYFSHTVCKYSISGNSISLDKKVGVSDPFSPNDPTNANVYMQYPMGIDFGTGSANHENTLFVVNRGRMEVTMLDKDDLSYKDHFGETGVSLFQGAKEAISFVLNDSATTQQANFGIGFWHSSSGKFTGFNLDTNGNIDYTKTTYCHSDACLNVGINPKGAQQILDLFEKDSIHLGYKTRSKGFKNIIHQYFNHANKFFNPYRIDLACQTTAIIIIGDGEIASDWKQTKGIIQALNNKNNPILTFSVGYGKDVYNSSKAKNIFKQFAEAGGTHDPANGLKGFYIAETPADLKQVTDTIVQSIIEKQVVFSAPSISSEIKRSGELFQAKFQNRSNKEWFGTIIKTNLTGGTGAAITANQSWDAADVFRTENITPEKRKIWTALPNSTGINNFHKDNVDDIRNLLTLQGNVINEYHRVTEDTTASNLHRCKTSGVKDGVILDEDVGIINFVRGEDYFDYDHDCDLTEPRMRIDKKNGTSIMHMMADIYNSTLLIVGNPKASVESTSTLSEAYYRVNNNYSGWAAGMINRGEVIYGAANNGILHAFSTTDQGAYVAGEEMWGFVPPLIIPKLPTIINGSLNQTEGGGSKPRFLLDGSPIAHDTYFKHPILNSNNANWYTLLMIPYGRAGAGFSLLDVSDPTSPLHLYSILNDSIGQKILRVDHTGQVFQYPYITTRLNESDFEEIQTVKSSSSTDYTCNSSTANGCYKSKTLTLKSQSIDKTNTTISVNGIDVTASTTITETLGDTILTFTKDITHSTQDPDQGGIVDAVRIVEIGPISSFGAEYDYRRLGETWASPRVFRMPNNGPGDKDVTDDEYVAVMPGGFGNFLPQIGSNLYVIDWTTGKVKKEIRITDKQYDSTTKNDIVNSTPSTPVVITADAAKEAYSGALVYINDIEGKITKINLTNMSGSYALDSSTGAVSQNTASASTTGSGISLYDSYTFFDLDVSTLTNNRYMYHSLDAGIGIKSNKLWLFGGTGDYMNLNDSMVDKSKVKNVMFGIKDKFFPYFGSEKSGGVSNIDNLSKCKDMTGNTTDCPDISDRGWYVELDSEKKVTSEPTLTRNVVYYPVYKPIKNDPTKCGAGEAYICAYDADCGRNLSTNLAEANKGIVVSNPGTTGSTPSPVSCYYVGEGVLSKIVSFGTKLYANISGTSINTQKTDIVVINAVDTGLVNYRSSWRESF